jgi:hypothetical protein
VATEYPLWKYYPARDRAPDWVAGLVQAFADSAAQLDSRQGLQMTSDKALAHLRPALVALGFEIEGGKKSSDKLRRPVLFGEQGREERAYEVDGFHPVAGVALEIEAGRGTQGNAIYRDLIQTSLLIDARYLALGALIEYHHSRARNRRFRRTTAKR